VGALILAGCGNPTPEERARIEKEKTAEALKSLHAAYDEQFEVVRVRWVGPDMFGKIRFGGVILRPASSQDPLDYFDAKQLGTIAGGTLRWVDNYLCVSSWHTYAAMVSNRISEVFPVHRVIVWVRMWPYDFLPTTDGTGKDMTREEFFGLARGEARLTVLIGVSVPQGASEEDLSQTVEHVSQRLGTLPVVWMQAKVEAYTQGVDYEVGVEQFLSDVISKTRDFDPDVPRISLVIPGRKL
jgi:hypothetical protein